MSDRVPAPGRRLFRHNSVETTTTERARRLATDVMMLSRNRLTVDLRYIANPISMLRLTQAEGLDNIMVDGRSLWYDPIHILRSYQEAKELPVRKYLHVVLHCIYQHFFISTQVDRPLWDLACDIAVEATIEEADIPSTTVPAAAARQKKELAKIRASVPHMTAEVIYKYLRDKKLGGARLAELHGLFSMDTHDAWYERQSDDKGQDEGESSKGSSPQNQPKTQPQPDTGQDDKDDADEPQTSGQQQNEEDEGEGDQEQPSPSADSGSSDNSAQGQDQQQQEGTGGSAAGQQHGTPRNFGGNAAQEALRDEWKRAAEKMRMDIQAFGDQRQGKNPGSGLMDNLNYAVRERYDYEAFLRQFGVLGEAMKINDEEFDYSFYCYGMDRYGNMPLIEPLEYKDVKAVREFVIAIDTSGSTSGDLVQTFLRKTYNILTQRENFHTKINVRIIQCDAAIQEDVKITNLAELEEYMKTMKIRGLGGTDFRPVFSHVDKLIADGELPNLKGLIYFTDGYGTFPDYQPKYKSAFVFIDDGFEDPPIPVWGIKLVLEPEEIEAFEEVPA